MDNTDKATPRPWTTGLNIKSIILAANNTIQVAECFPDNPNFKPKSPEANAALIVKAVNRDQAWEPMLEALRKISKIAGLNYERDEKLRANAARTLVRICHFADTAIALAESTQS